jgi:hypothetical protein
MRARTFVVAMAWLATVVCTVLLFAFRPGNSFTGSGASLIIGGFVLVVVSDASVGAILTIRRPGNVVGFVLLLAAVLGAVTMFAWVYGAAFTAQRGGDDFLAGLLSLIGASGFFPLLFVGGPLLALLFPTGRLPGPGWRWPVGAMLVAFAVALASGVVHPGQIPGSVANNPFGASAFSGSEALWTVGAIIVYASLPVGLVLAIAAVIVRVRRSRGVQRAQLKWFVAANVAMGLLLTLGFADGGLDLGLYAGISPTIFDVLAVASLSLPSIAVGVAIMRYHLFEIDRIISRTVSWALMTGLLGAVFVGLVVGLQALSTKVTGTNTLAVAASTLVVAAAFQPVRRRVQVGVDRRFNRATYDAERTTDAFAAQLRDEVDLARLNAALVETVNEAVRPASATVWLRSGAEVGR